ncbi:MAG: class I tRNA ligase family protein, partial [Patescibacteria group bacterium]
QMAVKEAFLKYKKAGLIYKGERVINWCSRCQSSLSDMELEHKEEKTKLYYIKYPLVEGGYISVATTRPETMLGDTGLAVNPKDKRYKKLIGKKAILPIINIEIPIVKDLLIDPKFGTGAVKVTPAHDMTDYQIGLNNGLELKKIIDENGNLTGEIPKKFIGLSIEAARELVIKELEKQKLITKIEDYIHRVPYCYRCKTKIESIPSEQWFVNQEKLALTAQKEVKQGRIKFTPKRFEKTFFSWISNIRDWCISRQIWWGHEIPIPGETDVLDTWFSSALWPFATLGWPKKTKDLKRFYPTMVLSTAKDIINLWVLRMIFSGIFFMKKAPFQIIFIHPMVLAEDGTKMSKSIGNVINPIDLIEKYGADATRLSLSWGVTGNQDMRFSEENVVMGQKFCNKMWNATRFILMQAERERIETKTISLSSVDKNQIIVRKLQKLIKTTDKNIDNFEFGKTIRTLYDFFWHTFCDQYIEKSKKQILKSKTKAEKKKVIQTLLYVLINSLKLLHPFIPFITEEIYQNLEFKNKKPCLMIEDWPK